MPRSQPQLGDMSQSGSSLASDWGAGESGDVRARSPMGLSVFRSLARMSFVLVHSPLIGPGSWSPVADVLEEAGHRVVVPDLRHRDSGEHFWEAQVAVVAEGVGRDLGGSPMTLVGHSGAGPLLPLIGAEFRGQVSSYVFVDAGLPHPGQSRFEALPVAFVGRIRGLSSAGRLPPWVEWFGDGVIEEMVADEALRAEFLAESPSLPLRLFEETLPDVESWPDAPCSYLRLSDAYLDEHRAAEAMGWSVQAIDANHLSILTAPGQVAEAIVLLGSPLGWPG